MKRKFMAASINPQDVEDILRECAMTCIFPYFRNLSDDDISQKGDEYQSRVTVADHKAEAFLSEKLTALLPGSYVVGEEGVHEDESLLEHLKDEGKQVWIIDPIDGTYNFSVGSKTFCVMLALVEGGETKKAWIYDVCNNSMAYGERGKGVFIDGHKVEIDTAASMHGATGFTSIGAAKQQEGVTVKSLRCAGHEYLKILKNEAVFALYGFMSPWDHAAGAFMVEEAGGYVAKWDGSPYSPRDNKGGILAANNQDTWRKVHGYIPERSLKKQGISP